MNLLSSSDFYRRQHHRGPTISAAAHSVAHQADRLPGQNPIEGLLLRSAWCDYDVAMHLAAKYKRWCKTLQHLSWLAVAGATTSEWVKTADLFALGLIPAPEATIRALTTDSNDGTTNVTSSSASRVSCGEGRVPVHIGCEDGKFGCFLGWLLVESFLASRFYSRS